MGRINERNLQVFITFCSKLGLAKLFITSCSKDTHELLEGVKKRSVYKSPTNETSLRVHKNAWRALNRLSNSRHFIIPG